MRNLLILFLLFMSSFLNAECLKNIQHVELKGTVIRKTYQSPDDVPKPVKRWILQLDEPFKCVIDIDKSFDAWDSDVTILPQHSMGSYDMSPYLNKHVSIPGKIVISFTANHHTAVLLLAEKVNIISDN